MGTHWDDYNLALWVDNPTDAHVSMGDATPNIYSGDNSVQTFLMAPRSYGVTFAVNY